MYGVAKLGAGVASVGGALVLALVVVAGGIASSLAAQGAVGVTDPRPARPRRVRGPRSGARTLGGSGRQRRDHRGRGLALGAGERGAQIALMVAYTESSLENLGPEAGQRRLARPVPTAGGRGLGDAERGTGPDRRHRHVRRTAHERCELAEHRAVGGGPGRAGLGLQRSAVCVQRWFVGARWQLQGELDPGRHILGRHHRIGRAHGLRWGERRRAGRPGQRLRVAPGLRHPVRRHPAETVAITYAISKLGDAYVWGAAGPASFDCSGLTMMAWAQAGVVLAHYTGDQMHEGTPVDGFGAISPGDLVLIPGSDGTLANPGHVGLYIGEGLVLSATDPEQGVIVQTWANFTAGGLSGIRHLG